MRYRVLGKTGLQVAEVGFGGWAIGGNRFGRSLGSTDDAESLFTLEQAYAAGCNLFVTSDLYGQGHSEALIGRALKSWKRDDAIIVTQGGQDFSAEARLNAPRSKPNFSAAYLKRAVEESLNRLGVDVIDLYLLHTPPLELIQHGQVFETLEGLKAQGKIRFTGVSIQDPQEGIQAIQIGSVDAVMAAYNLFDTRAEKQLFSVCQETGTGLLIREPLARGFLSGALSEATVFEPGDVRSVWPMPLIVKRIQAARRFEPLVPDSYGSLTQLSLAYALRHPAVSAIVPDCRTADEAKRDASVSGLLPLPEETLRAIREIQDVL